MSNQHWQYIFSLNMFCNLFIRLFWDKGGKKSYMIERKGLYLPNQVLILDPINIVFIVNFVCGKY